MKILMLQGLPASGKSTYAKELVHLGGWKRINKDDLRAMLDNSKWSKGNERFVLDARDMLIRAALDNQQSVVVDDTNFAPLHERALQAIADQYKIPFEIRFFDASVEECIERDLRRPTSVGEKVIRKMYNEYLKPQVKPYVSEGEPVILCDIDGTLAHMGDRGPFEWDKVGNDIVDKHIKQLLTDLRPIPVILLSGRDSVCRPETERWLSENDILYEQLLMRPKDDIRKDNIVKRELFEEYVADKYNVLFVLDDRNQVVDMWRNELGLKCLQVAEGDF